MQKKIEEQRSFLETKDAFLNVDDEKSFDIIKAKAEGGDRLAMHMLAVMYLKGQGTEKDEGAYCHWTLRSAEAGNKTDYLAAAAICCNDEKKDSKEALHWAKLAKAESDLSEEEVKIADKIIALSDEQTRVMHILDIYSKETHDQCLEMLTELANEYHTYATIKLLIKMYANGDHPDKEKALYWLDRAAECSDDVEPDYLAAKYCTNAKSYI